MSAKYDAQGAFIWETDKSYQVNNQFMLGHGEKSVMLIRCYIRLSMQEVMAIRWHVGFSEAKVNWNALGSVMEKYPIVLATHEADLEVSKICGHSLSVSDIVALQEGGNVSCHYVDSVGYAELPGF